MVNDPIADMLTRIRNGLRSRKAEVEVPGPRINHGIARVLRDEGYILDYKPLEVGPQRLLRVYLKYGPDGEMVVTRIQRESRLSRRVYHGVDEIPRVRNGLGIAIVSTSKGVLSDRECRKQRVGGEVLCTVE
ncbi:MAG TPA: 30S ribosomal protein S8 [Planctomycetota bacterium]|nr:30S ribosomal protein S8 [Planctomycetota bacterium]